MTKAGAPCLDFETWGFSGRARLPRNFSESPASLSLQEFSMRILTFLLLIVALPAFGQQAAPGYPLTIHVYQTRVGSDCSNVFKGSSLCQSTQELSVMIDGSTYELRSETVRSKGLVALGDYPAKIDKESQKPTHEFTRSYKLQFPDGSTRTFEVVGQIGR
jgi:hypothetical protein